MKANKGFTLAEMLIALVLVGVIAALVIPKLLLSTGAKAATSKVQAAASSIEQLVLNPDPNNAADWSTYLKTSLNGAKSLTVPASETATGGCAGGTSPNANVSNYIVLKDGTIIAYGTGSAVATQATVPFMGTGVVDVCIDPAPAASSQGYTGRITITNGTPVVAWNTAFTTSSLIGAGGVAFTTAGKAVNTLAKTL